MRHLRGTILALDQLAFELRQLRRLRSARAGRPAMGILPALARRLISDVKAGDLHPGIAMTGILVCYLVAGWLQ